MLVPIGNQVCADSRALQRHPFEYGVLEPHLLRSFSCNYAHISSNRSDEKTGEWNRTVGLQDTEDLVTYANTFS